MLIDFNKELVSRTGFICLFIIICFILISGCNYYKPIRICWDGIAPLQYPNREKIISGKVIYIDNKPTKNVSINISIYCQSAMDITRNNIKFACIPNKPVINKIDTTDELGNFFTALNMPPIEGKYIIEIVADNGYNKAISKRDFVIIKP